MRRIILCLMIVSAVALHADAPEYKKALALCRRIYLNVRYIRSETVIKSPLDTFIYGGDCADMSALMVYLMESEGMHAEIVLLDLLGYESHHALVLYAGMWFDPTVGKMYTPHHFPFWHIVMDTVENHELLAGWRR